MDFDVEEYYREQDKFADILSNELSQLDARLMNRVDQSAIQSRPVLTLENISAFQDLSNMEIEDDIIVQHLTPIPGESPHPHASPLKSHPNIAATRDNHEQPDQTPIAGLSRSNDFTQHPIAASIPVNYDLRRPSARSPIQRDSDVHHLGLHPSSPIVVSSPEPSPIPQALKRQSTAESRRSSRKKAKTTESITALDISNISAATDVQMEAITSPSRKKAKTTEPTTVLDISNISVETDVQMEDITSFSSELPPPQPRTHGPTKPTSKRRPLPVVLPLPPAKRQRRMAPPIIIPSTSSPPSTAPSSPIDDFSTTLAAQPTMLELDNPPSRGGQKSTLLLDVQSRVAKFKVSKAGKGKGKSNRVVNLHEGEQEQSRGPDGPGDTTSIIFVDSQEDYSASIPVASTSRLPPKKTLSKPVVVVKSSTVTAGRKKATKPPSDPKKATNKVLKMTYADYVHQQVKEWMENPLPKEKIHAQCLKDLVVYYCSGNKNSVSPGTQIRVNFMLRHGATVVPKFDATIVTHIVMGDGVSSSTLLSSIRLKNVRQIPDHIPTINWQWILDNTHIDLLDYTSDGAHHECDIIRKPYFPYALVSDRINAGESSSSPAKPRKNRSASLSSTDGSELPIITANGSRNTSTKHYSGDMKGDVNDSEERPPSAATLIGEPSSRIQHDPLAPFYQMAKLDMDRSMNRRKEIAESDTEDDGTAPPKRGYTCDNKPSEQSSSSRKDNPNQYVIDKLTELMEIHRIRPTQDDKWRVYSYTKSIRALKECSKKITSLAQAKKLRGVGDKTAEKIMEIIETGHLRRLEYEQEDHDVKTMQLFNGIYGVGPATALRWCTNGCKSLEDLLVGKNGVKLSEAQRIGIKYYDDINARMPREETKRLFELIKPIALSIDPKLFVEVMGSYRRGKATCGDIDIMITRCPDDGVTHEGVLETLLKKLHAADILTEDLAVPEDFKEDENVYRGLCHLPGENATRMRRIDFLCVPWVSRGAALLYYTGDDIFNRAMRYKAGNMGYSLNQRGLSKGVIRDTKDRRIKLNTGTIVASETEEEIFKMLKVPWQEPHERVRA